MHVAGAVPQVPPIAAHAFIDAVMPVIATGAAPIRGEPLPAVASATA